MLEHDNLGQYLLRSTGPRSPPAPLPLTFNTGAGGVSRPQQQSSYPGIPDNNLVLSSLIVSAIVSLHQVYNTLTQSLTYFNAQLLLN